MVNTIENMHLGQELKVVGIGASAGGLDPLQHIVERLPANIENIAVIIAQHLSPDYKSMLVELMARKTSIHVMQVESGVKIKGNIIYIVPATSDVIVKNGKFQLTRPAEVGAHPSIDILLNSIAKEYKSNAVGIILSGTGKDGSKGIVAIKKLGGVVIVQDPNNAKYEGMPEAAIATNVADHILTEDAIGQQFTSLIEKKKISLTSQKVDLGKQTVLNYVLDLLEKRLGIAFNEYKISTIQRRFEKRMLDKKFTSEDDYLEYVLRTPEELDELFETMLIGVTSFFRDKTSFIELEKVYEKIIGHKKEGETIRVWVPGCATGEEAYTHAIVLSEALSKLKKTYAVQIFATDIDIRAVQFGRLAKYSSKALQNVNVKIKEKYFTKLNETTYTVNKNLVKMVLFSKHDVTSNPPFLRLDLISCRNLLIYFNTALQKRVFPLLYYALNPHGYLMLGRSEDIGRFQNLFTTISQTQRIYQRKKSDGKIIPLPSLKPAKRTYSISSQKDPTREDYSISEMVKETFYAGFDHPYVVIDNNMEIVEISGDIARYLQFKEGLASLNIIKLINPDLQLELRTLIGKVLSGKKQVRGNIRKFVINKEVCFVLISIKPLLYSKQTNTYYVVIFEAILLNENYFSMGHEIIEAKDSPKVRELEQDLDATKDYMNSLLQELETSNEELQAMNEELQSSNEELQASNEELESANEELQAANEELENAYSQLRESNKQIELQKEKLKRSERNLSATLNNTHVGFILVNKDYKILFYNSVAKELFYYLFKSRLQTDISLIKTLPDSVFPEFIKNFKNALEGKQIVIEQEIENQTRSSNFLHISYTPVEADEGENEVKYISISFLDITEIKQAELELKKAASIINSSVDAIISTRIDGRIETWNKGAEKLYGYTAKEAIGKTTSMLIAKNKQDDFPFIVKQLEAGKQIEGYETQRQTKDGKVLDLSLTVSPIIDETGEVVGISKIGRDVTERKRFIEEIAYQKSLLELQNELSPEGILVVSSEGKIVSFNKRFAQMWKFPKVVMNSQLDEVALTAAQEQLDNPTEFIKKVQYLYRHRKEDHDELLFKDGRIFERYGSPIRSGKTKDYGYVWFFMDVTDRRRLEKQREEFIATATHELKTPVTSIKGYAQVMQYRFKKAGDNESATYISKMDNQLNKLTNLISDLLDVTKIDAGKLKFHEEEFELNKLISEVVEDMQQTTDRHMLLKKLSSSQILWGDRDRVGQVLTNLLANAIKYSPKKSTITVSTKKSSSSVLISIKDQGIGISKEDQDKIFERFYRVNGKETYPGLGLGLFICAEIIARHNGSIQVKSDGKHGSVFIVSLPLKHKKHSK